MSSWLSSHITLYYVNLQQFVTCASLTAFTVKHSEKRVCAYPLSILTSIHLSTSAFLETFLSWFLGLYSIKIQIFPSRPLLLSPLCFLSSSWSLQVNNSLELFPRFSTFLRSLTISMEKSHLHSPTQVTTQVTAKSLSPVEIPFLLSNPVYPKAAGNIHLESHENNNHNSSKTNVINVLFFHCSCTSIYAPLLLVLVNGNLFLTEESHSVTE